MHSFYQTMPRCLAIVALLAIATTALAQVGLDVTGQGGKVAGLERRLASIDGFPEPLWLQLEELQGAMHASETEQVRTLLQKFKSRGHRLCVEVRFVGRQRYAPLRLAVGHAPPQNLHLIYRECRELGRSFGDLVDAWEIENEPEIGFFWGTSNEYAAVLKAGWLGFQQGFSENRASQLLVNGDSSLGSPEPLSLLASKKKNKLPISTLSVTRPRVLMAPFALPPGPFLESLVANDLFAYTDGFNFHYYGYAGDFPDTYERWRKAVMRASTAPWWRRLGRRLLDGGYWILGRDESAAAGLVSRVPESFPNGSQRVTNSWQRKALPVFITEYGYGMLTTAGALTTEGRQRQAKWYAEMMVHLREVRPEAAMAFRLTPKPEGQLEFGLSAGDTPLLLEGYSVFLGAQAATDSSVSSSTPKTKRTNPPITNNTQPTNLPPESRLEPMPALRVILSEAGRAPWVPEPFRVWVERRPRGIVPDFLPGPGMTMDKDADAYRLPAGGTGSGTVRIYNFGAEQRRGRVVVTGNSARNPALFVSADVEIGAGEHTEVPVNIRLPDSSVDYVGMLVEFIPEGSLRAESVLLARLVAADQQYRTVLDLTNITPGTGGGNLRLLAERPRQEQEPAQRPCDGWLLTKGVEVNSLEDGWLIKIVELPDGGARWAEAEWVLPDNSVIPYHGRLSFEGSAFMAGVAVPAARHQLEAGIRTTHGNLYSSWRQFVLNERPAPCAVAIRDLTLQFYARAQAPGRFKAERSASIVFRFRPSALPATYLVSRPRLQVAR